MNIVNNLSSMACNYFDKSQRRIKRSILMTIDGAVFRFAGFVVLLAVTLTFWVHPNFIWLAAFAGLNLLQASFTGFCPAAIVFKKLGCTGGTHFK